jgi:hypothetical protein
MDINGDLIEESRPSHRWPWKLVPGLDENHRELVLDAIERSCAKTK